MAEVDEQVAETLAEHVLVNSRGDRVRLLNFGARICSVELQMRRGPREVVLGYDTNEACMADAYFMGSTVGRVCNRIAGAGFSIDNERFKLAADETGMHLHGGPAGFYKRYWHIGGGSNGSHVEFCLDSADGDQGYPGRLHACVRYTWTDERELRIRYSASTDRPTHVNLSNHAYFNLDASSDTILDHQLQVDSDSITETDTELLPTGRILSVAGTSLDLSSGRSLRDVLASDDPNVKLADGIDTNFVLHDADPAAVLTSGSGDLSLEVATTCPGLQVYTGQHLGMPFRRYGGICLEAQYFPDAANQPEFPETLLRPGQTFSETTTYRFIES